MTKRPLFNSFNLSDMFTAQVNSISEEVDKMEENYILNTPIEDLCEYLRDKYSFDPPQIDEGGIHAVPKETSVDVSGESSRVILDRSRPFFVKGMSISYVLPYTGDGQLLHCQPATFTMSPPYAEICNNTLVLEYRTTSDDGNEVKRAYERDKSEIQRYLNYIARDVNAFNDSLKEKAKGIVNARRNRLMKNQGLVESLGVPIRRTDAPRTYKAPVTRKKIAAPKPVNTEKPFKPEPALQMQVYEDILGIIQNMTSVIERSPHAFQDMSEEDLRQHFLVQLNGQFEGKATGETFNMSGKTDILIREGDKNIFVAECKIWKGPKSFSDAIDQLLSYSAWRDNKTAILLFCKGKDFTKILEKIPSTVEVHQSYKRTEKYDHETGFRFVVKNQQDEDKEIILTVLAFHMPGGK